MNKQELIEKNRDYWTKREKSKLNKGLKDVDRVERLLKKEYKKAMDNIAKDIAFFMSKYATDNNLTYDEANKLLNSKEMKDFRMSLKEYVELIEETGDKELLLELNTLSMRSRISRLEALYFQCDKYINELTQTTENSLQMLFTDTVKDNYYKTIYDYHKFVGIGYSFAKIDDKLIKDILTYPWSGRDYSSRIWTNSTKLKNVVREEITQMIIQGKSLDKTVKSMEAKVTSNAKNKQSHYKNCARLINTEHSYFMGEATARAYEELGVEKYEFLATLDTRTSKICQSLDGEVFNMSDRSVGVNASPMHPRCRSTEIPYTDTNTTRFARDSKGRGIEVPSTMKYEEWKKIYGL